MKILMLLAVLAVMIFFAYGVLPGSTQAAAADTAVESLFPQQEAAAQSTIDIRKAGSKPSPLADFLKTTAKRLDSIEARLGPATRQPTSATTIERRLADIEQRLDRLEQQYNRIQQMEQRIRKLEGKRY